MLYRRLKNQTKTVNRTLYHGSTKKFVPKNRIDTESFFEALTVPSY
jgi:hypothetical protein